MVPPSLIVSAGDVAQGSCLSATQDFLDISIYSGYSRFGRYVPVFRVYLKRCLLAQHGKNEQLGCLVSGENNIKHNRKAIINLRVFAESKCSYINTYKVIKIFYDM